MLEILVVDFLPSVLIATLAIALLAWIIRLALFFGNRIRKRSLPNPHEAKETMGLPKGAIRTFLTLTFTAIAILSLFGVGDLVPPDDKKWILGQLGVIIAFYFGSKAVEAYADSRVKLAAIDKATGAQEAMAAYRDLPATPASPRPQPMDQPVPPITRGGPSN